MAFGSIMSQKPNVYTDDEVLTDETKAIYGLGPEAVPDDVFNLLDKSVAAEFKFNKIYEIELKPGESKQFNFLKDENYRNLFFGKMIRVVMTPAGGPSDTSARLGYGDMSFHYYDKSTTSLFNIPYSYYPNSDRLQPTYTFSTYYPNIIFDMFLYQYKAYLSTFITWINDITTNGPWKILHSSKQLAETDVNSWALSARCYQDSSKSVKVQFFEII